MSKGNETKHTHTPGPWHVQPDTSQPDHPFHRNRFITCGHPDMTSDEWANDPDSYIVCSMRDCQNQKANAALIASAPSLLAERDALRAALLDLAERVCAASEMTNPHTTFADLAAKARAALAIGKEGK